MKKLIYLIVLALILGLVLTGCSLLSNISQVPATEQSGIINLTKGTSGAITLYADQDIPVGTVSVWNDCTDLHVTYDITEPNWVMTETHLAVVTDLSEFPTNKAGNPKVGLFPHKREYDFIDGVREDTYTISDTRGVGTTLYIAAHAVVEKQIEGEIIQEEPVWGAGTDFSGKNWATYFTYNIALAVGDSYGGGKVAYILQSGDPGYITGERHGLIAAAADQGKDIIWALFAYEITTVPGTLTTIGSGSANTDKIITQNGGGSGYAAGLARACTDGGYSDWFLPSKDELDKLFDNKDAIGGFDVNGVNLYYWSSSEYDLSSYPEFNAKYAWSQNFNVGNQSRGCKWFIARVRAVRAF